MRPTKRLVAALAALVLFTAACGGSGDDAGEDSITFDGDGGADGDDDDSSDGDDAGGGDDDGSSDDSDGDDGTDGDSSGGAGDFMTVFGLPPGDAVETDYAPYEFREDEFGTSESVTFEVTGSTVDEIIAFYQQTVPAMGYVVDDPIQLGESIALNISDPNNPGTTAVIQAGETQGVITVHHNANRLNPPDDTDDEDDSASASGSSDGEGDDASASSDADSAAITINGSSVDVDWAALTGTPFYAPADQANDPFFHIHTDPAADGFFLSLEMYTEWGQAWMGETGGFEISCSDPATSTGICPYFDPDGPGPLPVLGGDFMTTGQIIINELGPGGYDLAVGPIIFSDGTVINPFTMTG
ncbi:MAG: hypothetical protein AAGA90_06845 [Actinomycetota bacterium]